MEGYFNFGFTNSVRRPSSWFSGHKASEGNYRVEVEWSSEAVDSVDSVTRGEAGAEDGDTVDTDLDSDSFLSDLERDSGEQQLDTHHHHHHQQHRARLRQYSEQDWAEAVHSGGYGGFRDDRGFREDRGYRDERLHGEDSCHRDETFYRDERGYRESRECSSSSEVSPVAVAEAKQRPAAARQQRPGRCQLAGLQRLDCGCVLGLLSLAAAVFALISPHWLVTAAPGTNLRLSPWEVCGRSGHSDNSSSSALQLRGCYSVWAAQLEAAGLVPRWFVIVAAALLLGAGLSLSGRALLFLLWFKKRQIFPLKLGGCCLLLCAALDLAAGCSLLTSAATFAASVLSSASLAPGSSSLSWGWAAALTSAWGHVATGVLVAREAARQRTRRRHSENFLRGLQQQQQQAAPSIVV